MMAVRSYTKDELLQLRESPLVHKPEDLPAIEQWLEYVYVDRESREKLRIPHSEPQHAQNAGNARRQPQHAKGETAPMGNFSTGMRPSMVSRTTGSKNGGRFLLAKEAT